MTLRSRLTKLEQDCSGKQALGRFAVYYSLPGETAAQAEQRHLRQHPADAEAGCFRICVTIVSPEATPTTEEFDRLLDSRGNELDRLAPGYVNKLREQWLAGAGRLSRC